MKLHDPTKAGQAMPSSNVAPGPHDDGTRQQPVATAPAPATKTEEAPQTEPHHAAPTTPPPPPSARFDFTLEELLDSVGSGELDELIEAVRPALDKLRGLVTPRPEPFAVRVERLVRASSHGIFQSGGAPAPSQIVDWAAEVIQKIEASAKLEAERVSRAEVEARTTQS